MDTLGILLWSDWIGVTRWFTTKSAGKFVVVLLFILLFGAISYATWRMSDIFFRSLAIYEQFGAITAAYILHAAVLVVLWLAIGSSVASSVGFLVSPTPTFSYLMTLPVQAKHISRWLYVKSVIANFLLMMFAFVPIAAAYGNAFGAGGIVFIMRVVLVLLCIVCISSGIGMVIALASAAWIRGKEYMAGVAGMGIFFTVMVGLLKTIFPPALSKLYDASALEFLDLFRTLPLNNQGLPTSWLSQTITHGVSLPTLAAAGVTLILIYITLGIHEKRLISVLLRIRSSPHSKKISGTAMNALETTSIPLVVKDWLSIVRVASELGYGLFLVTVAVFFFLFLSFGIGNELRQEIWRVQLTVFSFAWLVFFAIAIYLRFLFPLVAREGRSAWYIFTLPISRTRLLFSKILLSILVSVPIMICSGLVWYWLPFVYVGRDQLVSLTIIVLLFVSLVQVLMGAILPNFSQGNDPEKVSTSGMGILTLFLCGILAFIAGLSIEHLMKSEVSGMVYYALILGSGMTTLFVLWFAANQSMKRWEW